MTNGLGFIWRDTGALARATAGAAAERRTPGMGGVGKKTRSYVCIVHILANKKKRIGRCGRVTAHQSTVFPEPHNIELFRSMACRPCA